MKNKKLNSILVVVAILILIFSLVLMAMGASLSEYRMIEGISRLLTAAFVLCSCYWAVIYSNKITGIFGAICLTLSQFLSLVYPVSGSHSNLFVILIATFASIVLLIAMAVGKNKALRLIPLGVLGVVSLFHTVFNNMLLFGVTSGFFIVELIFNVLLLAYFILLSAYVMVGGKPLERKSSTKTVPFDRNGIPAYKSNSHTLTEQLTQLKSEFEAGKISEEEYKKQRMQLLKKSCKNTW